MKTMSQLFRKGFLIGLVLGVFLLVGCGSSIEGDPAKYAQNAKCMADPQALGCPDLDGDGQPG